MPSMSIAVMVHSLEGPPEERTLFLGDLSVYCTEDDIFNFFSVYGAIEKIRIKRAVNNKNLSYGFVTYTAKETASRVLATMNGQLFLGRALRLGWAAHKSQLSATQLARPTDLTPSAQIHVSFLSKQTDILITETTLRSLFERFGGVSDVAIKKIQFNAKLRIQNGYGFIHFPLTKEGVTAAINATNIVRQYTIDRVTYDSCLTRSLEIVIQTQYYPGQLPPVVPYPEHSNFVNKEFGQLSTYGSSNGQSSVFNLSSLNEHLPNENHPQSGGGHWPYTHEYSSTSFHSSTTTQGTNSRSFRESSNDSIGSGTPPLCGEAKEEYFSTYDNPFGVNRSVGSVTGPPPAIRRGSKEDDLFFSTYGSNGVIHTEAASAVEKYSNEFSMVTTPSTQQTTNGTNSAAITPLSLSSVPSNYTNQASPPRISPPAYASNFYNSTIGSSNLMINSHSSQF